MENFVEFSDRFLSIWRQSSVGANASKWATPLMKETGQDDR
jgi:hypothetical protein